MRFNPKKEVFSGNCGRGILIWMKKMVKIGGRMRSECYKPGLIYSMLRSNHFKKLISKKMTEKEK
jgi:hypothetical protein